MSNKERSDNLILLKRYRELVSKIEKLLEEKLSPDTRQEDEIDFPVDVFIETKRNEVVIEIEMAGLQAESVKLSGFDSLLEISGKKETMRDSKYESCVCLERENGAFKKLLKVDIPVDFDGAEACFKNGVLEIRLPMTVEKRVTKTITIKNED